jgi:hypothetical protein
MIQGSGCDISHTEDDVSHNVGILIFIGTGDEDIFSLQMLPKEVLLKIVTYIDLVDRQKLACVSRKCCNIIQCTEMPMVYLRPSIESVVNPRCVSVKKIICHAGRGSGLCLALMTYCHLGKQWDHAWLKLVGYSNGWYAINKAFWKL